MDVVQQGAAGSAPPAPRANSPPPAAPPMLSPQTAWRILCSRTGGHISRATFYRWVSEGKVLSIRLGIHIFIPRPSLEDLIRRCLAGQRF